MLIPRFWAESRRQHRQRGRQITVRRFGWSDTDQAAAQQHADQRAEEALEKLKAGEFLLRQEQKTPYNGADGLPIREEIVDRQGDTVITRNAYGARCLNTPNVLFADIDFSGSPSPKFIAALIGALLAAALALGWLTHSILLGGFLALLALFAGIPLAAAAHRLLQAYRGGPEQLARERIARFLRQHLQWHVRLYRTPAGLRLLATHRTFSPNDPEVSACFEAIGTDPVYARMCWNQQCFRARVSAKPWRIGIARHLRLRPGVWPVAPEHLPARQIWVDTYEGRARGYAACQFMAALGSGHTDPEVLPVQELHDRLCRAESGLPLA